MCGVSVEGLNVSCLSLVVDSFCVNLSIVSKQNSVKRTKNHLQIAFPNGRILLE